MATITYELFLPRGMLSKPSSLSKRRNAVQVFQDAMEKVSPRIKHDFDGMNRWIIVINQPCLHTSNKRPKNRYRTRQPSSKGNRKPTASAHYTAYGYLSAAPAFSTSNKGRRMFANRWWMHVDAENHVDYAPHPRQGKMWRKEIHGKEIVPLAGPFEI